MNIINSKKNSRKKITILLLCFAAVTSALFFLIFNESSFGLLRQLLQIDFISDSRAARINKIISIFGVTVFFLLLYLAYPTKLLNCLIIFNKNKNRNTIFFFFIIILMFSLRNINNPNFWFDESGQIWMSLGLNHFTPPFSSLGALKDVYLNNNVYNLDPGGFTYLLRLWMSLGESPAFIRTLPFLFSIGTIALSGYLLRTNFTQSRLVIFSPLVFLGSPLFTQYSFELRAYSFEMLVALSALTLALRSKKILESTVSSVVVGLWLALGLSSRYSSIFPIVLAIVFVTFDAIKSNKKNIYLNLSLIVFPILLSATLIFICVLSKQNPGGEPPSYVSDLLLFNRGFFGVFFAPWAILVWLPVVLLLIVSVRLKNNHYLQRYVAYSLSLLLTLVVASALNKYPLGFHTRFDISIHSVYWFGWALLLSLLISRASRLLSNEKYLFLVSYLAAILVILASFARYQPNDSIYEIFDSCYVYTEKNLILANEGSMPTVKYIFELGPLKSFDHIYAGIDFFSEGRPSNVTAVPSENINIDNYNYFLFSHFDKDGEIYSKITISSDFIRCDTKGPSEMYFRAATNHSNKIGLIERTN